jgi:transcriptional regulator with XRE-family HTH domain
VPLAADNNARLCGKCRREQHGQLRDAPARHSPEFFETDDLRAALQSRDMGRVFTAYRNHPRHLKLFGKALNQETLGRWLGLTQAQVSKIEHNSRPETRLDLLIGWAQVLQLPSDMLWFDMPDQSRFANNQQSGQEPKASIPPNGGLVVPQPPDQLLVAHTGMDTLELLRRVRASAIDSSTVDALDITVQQLCCDYAHADPHELMKDGRNWLSQMIGLLGHRLTLSHPASRTSWAGHMRCRHGST